MRPVPRRESPAWLEAVNPFGWLSRTVESFHPSAAPPLTRANYRRELIAAFFLPWVLAIVEGGVIAVIVQKYFEGVVGRTALDFAVATVTSAPAFANITSFLWVRLTHGRHKVRSVNSLQASLAALVGLIALAPRSGLGLVIVVACTVAGRVCLAGVVTIRAGVWRQNYPREVRARLTGRIATVVAIVIGLVGTFVGLAMEWQPWSFRALFPLAAVVSLVGVRVWGRVRMRGHGRLLQSERVRGREGPSFNPLMLGRVLANDRRFAFFMLCQFAIGTGNMMLFAPIVLFSTEYFELGYFQGILVSNAVPILMMPLFIGPWSRLLDAWHISKYRSVHSWVFVVMALLIFASARLDALWLLYLGVAARGIAFAGGQLAWNLGHNDFATDENASEYMAVHVTLTGIRGLLAPFVGVPLYRWFAEAGPAEGAWVFVVGAAIVAVGAVGFFAQHRVLGRRVTSNQ
ncbi:MAG: MFS transporter [Phycisphaeraceae bacterium]|nr:MAG: MFS transporter [Phycisphaeraceae bacterium]